MKFMLKFAVPVITVLCFSLNALNVFAEEVVDLKKFSDYGVVEELKGGEEFVEDNFFTVERTYELKREKKLFEITLSTYVVKKGDTLGKIAKEVGQKEEIIRKNNPNVSFSSLKIGTKLTIYSENGIYHKVKKGDSLSRIASIYKVKVEELTSYNDLEGNTIKVGQNIFVKDPNPLALKSAVAAIKGNSVAAKTATKKAENFKMPVKWLGVSSKFGSRLHPVLKRYIQHTGVDLKARYTQLHAAKDGKVSFAGYMGAYGKIIIIKHKDGYETRSAHLNDIYVKTGQSVSQGEVIGKTGMSGRVTGPHLHFEIRKGAKPDDPMKYLIR